MGFADQLLLANIAIRMVSTLMCCLDADAVHRKTGRSAVKTKIRLICQVEGGTSDFAPTGSRQCSRGHSGSRSGWSSTKYYLEPKCQLKTK